VTKPDATSTRLAGSFRDPAGFVFRASDGIVYRQVDRGYAATYDRLRASGLYDALVRERLLIEHEEVDVALALEPATAARVLRPRQLRSVIQPYEWTHPQLHAAALATLRVQQVALDHGMTLKDASAYNVQFEKGAPFWIDTLSFEEYREGEPWRAYRQFCEHFLAPLALLRYVDASSARLLQLHLDGVPLGLARRALPLRARLRPGLLMHVALHAAAQERPEAAERRDRRARLSRAGMLGLVASLRRTATRLAYAPRRSAWSGYEAAVSYSPIAHEAKLAFVSHVLDEASPRIVLDLGANDGEYARLAAAKGASVVAIERDPEAAARCHERAAREGLDIQTVVADVTNPSPGIGWRNAEREPLEARIAGADLVLALALTHHLAVRHHVGFAAQADLLAALAPRALVELVPADDPQAARLLESTGAAPYTREAFEDGYATRFDIAARHPLKDSARVIYDLRRR
jgi:ribosomal protein L11 methylase PrmA